MSFKFTDAVFKAKLPPSDKAVLNALATRANDDGVCWPGHSTIAKDCGFSVSTVKRIISRLEKNGAISIGKRPIHRGFVNQYTLNLERIINWGSERASVKTPSTGGQSELQSIDCSSLRTPYQVQGELGVGSERATNTSLNSSEEDVRMIHPSNLPEDRLTEHEKWVLKIQDGVPDKWLRNLTPEDVAWYRRGGNDPSEI